jgi:hypothetical protein
MAVLRERIIEKLHDLPDEELREVLSFVDFLNWRSGKEESALLSVAGILTGKSLTSDEIEEELYGNGKGR